MCIDINSLVQTKIRSLGSNFENVGRTTWLGTKRYLVYNPSEGWGFTDLNFVQRIFRYFLGAYEFTHVKRIYAQLIVERQKYLDAQSKDEGIVMSIVRYFGFAKKNEVEPFPWGLFEKIEFAWARAYNILEAGVLDVPRKLRELNMKCRDVGPGFSSQSKDFVYQQLLRGAAIEDTISFRKYCINDETALLSKRIFVPHKKMEAYKKIGEFSYPQSIGENLHWTANFSDVGLFERCQENSLTEVEKQAVEHPALTHLKAALLGQGSLNRLNGNQIALITGAYRYGKIDIFTPCVTGHSLYGENFAVASNEDILSKLTVFEHPVRSNIFSIAAPTIGENLRDRPYRRDHLKDLLFRSVAAFSAIKFECPTKKIIVHSGNWGCGAFGHGAKAVALIQLAAANFSGIDRLEYYPLDRSRDFDQAKVLFEIIERDHQNMTIDEFLTFLENNATRLGLIYGN